MFRVSYVWDEILIKETDRLPAVPGRASLVNNLITAYNLTDHMTVVRSEPATYNDLKEFHSELYLDHLKTFTEIDEEYMSNTLDEEFGIGYDCPPVSHMFQMVSTIGGGSITAAECLVRGLSDVAINWCGGWHHAQRFGAEGFCYVNDIVLAIEKLRLKFPKVLYIDLDVHHGNGVEDAYNLSKSVFTLSFHKYEPGFYPGTGSLEDIGTLAGRGYSCNVPLHAAYSDDTFLYVFEKVFPAVRSLFCPHAIVLQCGADALARDPHGGGALAGRGYTACVAAVIATRIPTLLLGGGGYNHPNAARLWTMLTAQVVGVALDEYIPEHESWPSYGPDYMLAIQPTLARDANTKSYLDGCIATILGNLEKDLVIEEINEVEAKRRKTEHESVECRNKTEKIIENKNELCDSRDTKPVTKLNERDSANSTEIKINEVDVYAFTDD